MATIALTRENQPTAGHRAATALKVSAWTWCLVAVLGQLVFAYFVLAFYGPATFSGNFAHWNKQDLIKGYVRGDQVGNLQFAVHVLMGALVTTSGAIQLLPQLRARAPAFHRWNGRVYVVMVLLMATGGLSLVWIRGTWLTLTGALGITLQATLLFGCATMAWRTAVARRFVDHQHWALRTFLLANGGWFQRIGYMAWILVNLGRPVGIGDKMDGPFDYVWGFSAYLLPLGILEMYMLARRRRDVALRFGVSGLLLVMTLLTALGSGGAYWMMWRPVLMR